MKPKLLICLLFFCSYAFAQKAVNEIINAEKSFAAYAITHNTPDAFLKFADSNAIVYQNGKPVNAIAVWSKKPKSGGKLNWRPQVAEIAASGDWGYTTGPWTYQPKTLEDSVVAQGQFSTIWHKTSGGEWKFIVDLGIDATPRNPAKETAVISSLKGRTGKDKTSFLEAEKNFAEAFAKDKIKAYRQYLSAQSIISRHGHLPASEKEAQIALIEKMPLLQFKIDGSGAAGSGDLAYVYGITVSGDKSDSYLRVWRLEPSGWKIAMETITFKY